MRSEFQRRSKSGSNQADYRHHRAFKGHQAVRCRPGRGHQPYRGNLCRESRRRNRGGLSGRRESLADHRYAPASRCSSAYGSHRRAAADTRFKYHSGRMRRLGTPFGTAHCRQSRCTHLLLRSRCTHTRTPEFSRLPKRRIRSTARKGQYAG